MRRRASLAVFLLLAGAFGMALPGRPVSAQDGQDAPPPQDPVRGAPAATDAPGDVEVLRTRGIAAWQSYVWTLDRQRLGVARNDLVEARRLQNGKADFTHLYLLAYAHLALGERDAGEAAAAEVQALAPTFHGLALLEAFARILDDRRDLALEALDRNVARLAEEPADPAFGTEFRLLARVHRGVQRYMDENFDGAAEDLEEALAICEASNRKPPNEAVLRLALTRQMLQEFDAAEELVTRLLADDPGNADLYYNLALLAGTRNRLGEARRMHNAALARRPGFAAPHIKLALLATKRIDEDPDALATMRRHLDAFRALVGDRPESHQLADLETGEGSYWELVARRLENAGRNDAARGAYERALAAFERALKSEPGCLVAITRIIQILYVLERPDAEVAPFLERQRLINAGEEGAPEAHRSTFC